VSAFSAGAGKGSEFVVRLPLSDVRTGPSVTDGQLPEAPNGVLSPRRVLVVDDNEDSAETLAQLLKITGHDVRTAYDGPAALVAAHAFHPDIVLLDIGLPYMDGYEVARQLRATSELAPMRIVALTGYGQEEDRRRAVEAGFDAHLVKPADPDELQHVIGQVEKADLGNTV
jgi:two-component system CheB/CheR fusion protein